MWVAYFSWFGQPFIRLLHWRDADWKKTFQIMGQWCTNFTVSSNAFMRELRVLTILAWATEKQRVFGLSNATKKTKAVVRRMCQTAMGPPIYQRYAENCYYTDEKACERSGFARFGWLLVACPWVMLSTPALLRHYQDASVMCWWTEFQDTKHHFSIAWLTHYGRWPRHDLPQWVDDDQV